MPQFDVVIGNPPYLRGTHLLFFEKSFEALNSTGQIVWVSPSTQFINTRKNTKYIEFKNKIKDTLVSADIQDLNSYFGTSMYVPFCITYNDKTKTDDEIKVKIFDKEFITKDINDINLIGPYKTIKSIRTKIKNKTKTYIKSHLNSKPLNYFVCVSSISGNGKTTYTFYDGVERTYKNMFNLINNTSNFVSDKILTAKPQGGSTTIKDKNYFTFNDKEEAQNFLNFITKSVFVKYIITSLTYDQNIDSTFNYIPYMDFSKEWTDEMLFNYFDINIEEQTLIYETVNKFKI